MNIFKPEDLTQNQIGGHRFAYLFLNKREGLLAAVDNVEVIAGRSIVENNYTWEIVLKKIRNS